MHIVWFKRDLRIEDNEALSAALQSGEPILPLYIVEPELWREPDMSMRHYRFLCESLSELNAALQKLGQPLIIRVGEAVPVLENLRATLPITALWSHQETWNAWTYARDRRVAAWARSSGIPWHEPPQHGVIRRGKMVRPDEASLIARTPHFAARADLFRSPSLRDISRPRA
jgi:deoxyribodipyrimidine photo-lyase